MDAKSDEVASESLKYQTWFLKVSIHCEGCRRKVKKVLRSIDGVFTTTIDPQQQKVTVTGSVGVETLIRKLVKAGKHAEIWPENLSGKAKKKKNEQKDPESVENQSAVNAKNMGIESADKCNGQGKSSDSKSPAGKQLPETDRKGGEGEGGGGGSSKKRKKKVQSGGSGSNGLSSASAPTSVPAHTGSQFQIPSGHVVGQMNLIPTRQQSYPYPETFYPPLVYLATSNRLCPMGTMDSPSYYFSPLPYMCVGLDQDPYQLQSTSLVSFEIFSDENANGCSVM